MLRTQRREGVHSALERVREATRLIELGRYAAENRRRRGEGKPETFNFLGFTHICTKTRQGYYSVRRHTMRQRKQAKLVAIKIELRKRAQRPIADQGAYLRSVVQGHLNYYGVPFNSRSLLDFRMGVAWLWWRSLRRRSQRHRLPWRRMKGYVDRWLPPAHICHPQPLARFRASHPRWEPDAGKPHVRI